VEWLGDLSCNLCFEDKFTASRALQNVSQEIPSPPTTTESDQNENYMPSDLANMGWRFCLQPIQKVDSRRETQETSLSTPFLIYCSFLFNTNRLPMIVMDGKEPLLVF
jgi:hypothetical protein